LEKSENGGMTKSLQSPSTAYYESIARSIPPDDHSELFSNLPQHSTRLLDAGCAAGRLTLRLAERAEFTVGIDLSHELIYLAHRLEGEQGTRNVAWVVGNMEHLPFQSESFDLVVSTKAVHLTAVQISLLELVRLTKPGARMLIQDILARPNPLRPVLLPYFVRNLKNIPLYLRLHGPVMLLRILAYRFSPVELRTAARVDRMSLEALQVIYEQAAPGCAFQSNGFSYLAIWQKPSETVTQL
jgi:SAM-dependent methyltransferase